MHASGRQTVTVEYIETAALDADGLALLSQTLSDEERARAARFHFERDRSVYIVGHALMRDMLARAVGGSAHDFAFTTGAHGKPEAVLAASAPRLRINLSHTRGLAAVAMTQDVDIGVDVEWMSRDSDLLNIAERFFAVDERRQLALAAETDRRDCFFAFWTLKEAYIKAIGLGLAMPLADFSFQLETLRIAFADHVDDDPDDWHFLHRRLSHDHALSLAVRHQGGPAPDVQITPADLARLLRG